MAEINPLQGLKEEAMCPICLGRFKDAVITPCGHNFCRSCIMESPQLPWAELCCPQCRGLCSRADLRPNRQLQNMVELVTKLSSEQRKIPHQGQGLCQQHQEKLKLFCQDDHKLICVICQVSSEHERHRVRPINEAAREYQGKLQKWLSDLKKRRDGMVISKKKEEGKYTAMRKKLETEKVTTAADFKRLRNQLKEQKQTIFERLEKVDRKITRVEKANVAKLYHRISSLDALIKDIKTKCKQPPEELLKDVRHTLRRCKKVKFCRPDQMKEKKEKDQICGNLNILNPSDVKQYKVLVTLDPETAHEDLVLSENERRVAKTHQQPPFYIFGQSYRWSPPPERFSASLCVLGKEGFCAGRHYWEVELLQESLGWTVGVALESVNRDLAARSPQKQVSPGLISPADCISEILPESPLGGVWAVHGNIGWYVALNNPCSALHPRESPKKLGVYLDYEGGRVSLYNGDTMEVLHTFSGASFNGKVYPYFNLCDNNDASFVYNGSTELRLV